MLIGFVTYRTCWNAWNDARYHFRQVDNLDMHMMNVKCVCKVRLSALVNGHKTINCTKCKHVNTDVGQDFHPDLATISFPRKMTHCGDIYTPPPPPVDMLAIMTPLPVAQIGVNARKDGISFYAL